MRMTHYCHVPILLGLLPFNDHVYSSVRAHSPSPCKEASFQNLITRQVESQNDHANVGLGVTLKSVTLGNVTMSHRTRERPAECLASLPLNYDRSARAQH
ncbi:hypothetical protein EVAR_42859_1 [Eumeta japonica]|uniref:Uncharacterized protein n=1 Tax=Eumeta variegata TaxID=151549 RepID=A0A4C1WFP0_EUMVA|nr:hypothetical protein EVAR_42859_1 [Eumeta japonica]